MLQELGLLSKAVKDALARSGFTDFTLVKLGKGDGLGTLRNPNGMKRDIWVRRSDTRELFTAYLPPNPLVPLRDGDPNIERIEVRVAKPPFIDRFVVIDALSLAGIESIGEVSPMEALIYAAFWTALKNITNLRARPFDPPTNDVLVDGPLWYVNPSTGRLVLYTTTSVGTAIQTAITALTAGKHQLGILYLDQTTNSLGLSTGTAVTATGALPARSEFTDTDVANIALPAYATSIIPIYLYYGQTGVAEADHYRDWDMRPFFQSAVSALVSSLSRKVDELVQVVSHHISHITDILQTQVLNLDPMMTSDPLAVEIFS